MISQELLFMHGKLPLFILFSYLSGYLRKINNEFTFNPG